MVFSFIQIPDGAKVSHLPKISKQTTGKVIIAAIDDEFANGREFIHVGVVALLAKKYIYLLVCGRCGKSMDFSLLNDFEYVLLCIAY